MQKLTEVLDLTLEELIEEKIRNAVLLFDESFYFRRIVKDFLHAAVPEPVEGLFF